ncbi:iron-sulfur cluster assembly scaffold protein [Parashewanella tropica]|uniref:iron-sulfur cluster assembly scaffold protein n=1 Tax=Parashewanella tropica TaxID=2547970 RepID=UPI00105A8460|nr:iron-sulfur cluster assembly scaffold protein [Parashewanella tropica]
MYNEIIIDNFSNPQNVGELSAADLVLEIGNPVCGDRIKVYLDITDNLINRAVFKAWGCATSIATANVFCSSIEGQNGAEIALRQPEDIEAMLGELEPSQNHCLQILEELHEKLMTKLNLGVS